MQIVEQRNLETDYQKIFRISWLIILIPIVLGPTIAFSTLLELGWIGRVLSGVVIYFFLVVLMWIWTKKWFNRYQYALKEEGLFIYKGVFWRQQQVVPRNRVQHIDITSGPLERKYQLSKLVVHTAGTRNASVTLPGLLQTDAAAMRQELINNNFDEDTV